MLRLTCCAALFPMTALADAPKVVVDIAPVHSLVAQVMQGVGTPSLLLDPSVSPHHATLRPSQASALQEADLVVMIGEGLTPSLPGMVASVASDAQVLDLLNAATVKIKSTHDHDHGQESGHDDHNEHGHDEDGHDEHADDKDDHGDHDDHGHDDHEEHADHKEGAHDGHDEHHDAEKEAGHEEGMLDPHAWLDIDNAAAWLSDIANLLADMDPANAQTYQKNAQTAQQSLEALSAALPTSGGSTHGFLAFHDAYAYFAQRQKFASLGSLASNEGVAPSASDINKARDMLKTGTVACIFTEPQFGPDVVSAVTEGYTVPVLSLDPLGAAHTPGPELYQNVIADMGAAFEACFAKAS